MWRLIEGDRMKLLKQFSRKTWAIMAMGIAISGISNLPASAQNADFGINLSGGKEPVQLNADNLEMRDKDGVAIFTGNVSVVQGDRIMRTSKLIVHYAKSDDDTGAKGTAKSDKKSTGKTGKAVPTSGVGGLGSTGVEKMEASGKVYIKTATQVATGDEGIFDGKSNIMVLTGQRVILADGDNIATGCKLTAHMDTGKAFMESCKSSGKNGNNGRVSIIMNRNEQNGK